MQAATGSHVDEMDDLLIERLPGLTAAPHELGLSAERLGHVGPVVRKFIDDGHLAGAVMIVARRG